MFWFNRLFACYQIIVHYGQIPGLLIEVLGQHSGAPVGRRHMVLMIHCSMPSSICRHVMCNITAVWGQIPPEKSNRAIGRRVQAGEDPILSELPRLSFSFVCHSSSQLIQAICFKKGESSNSLALGLFSWSISNVLLKNSWPSSLAFSGVVGFALEFPI